MNLKKRIATRASDGIVTYIAPPDPLISSLLREIEGHLCYLGPCETGSFLMNDFLGYVTSFDLNTQKGTVFQPFPDKPVTVLIKITDQTDYNELERLNETIQSAAQNRFKFVIVIDPTEYQGGRLTPSLFSRIIPSRVSVGNLTAVIPTLGKLDHELKLFESPSDWLRTPRFDTATQTIHFEQQFKARLNAHLNTVPTGSVSITFCLNMIDPELLSLFEALNHTGRADIYELDLSDIPRVLTFKVSQQEQNLEAMAETPVLRQQIQSLSQVTLDHPMVEITDFNINYVLGISPQIGTTSDNKWEIRPFRPTTQVYVASALSASNTQTLLKWLTESSDRICYFNSPELTQFIPKLRITPIPIPTPRCVSIAQMAQSNLPLYDYTVSQSPSRLVNGALLGSGSNFVVTQIIDIDLLRNDILSFTNTIFFMTPSVYSHITTYGPLVGCSNCLVLDNLPEVSTAIVHQCPQSRRWLSDTVVTRVGLLLEKEYSLTRAIDIGIIQGIPESFRSSMTTTSEDIESCEVPKVLYGPQWPEIRNRYTFPPCSLAGLSNHSNTQVLIAGAPQKTEFDVQLILDGIGTQMAPRWILPTLNPVLDTPPPVADDDINMICDRLSKNLIIGSQQRYMIGDIVTDLNTLSRNRRESSLFQNIRFFLGAPGTGKDEIVNRISEFHIPCQLVHREVFNPSRLDDYMALVREIPSTGAVRIINFQEINLSDDHVEAFERLALFIVQQPNLYVVATGNNFDSRAPISPVLTDLMQIRVVGNLSNTDVNTALDLFLDGMASEKPVVRHAIIEAITQSRQMDKVNFRLLDKICCHIKSLSTGAERWGYLCRIFGLTTTTMPPLSEATVVRQGAIQSTSFNAVTPTDLPPRGLTRIEWVLSVLVGLLAIAMRIQLFPWLPAHDPFISPIIPEPNLYHPPTDIDSGNVNSRHPLHPVIPGYGSSTDAHSEDAGNNHALSKIRSKSSSTESIFSQFGGPHLSFEIKKISPNDLFKLPPLDCSDLDPSVKRLMFGSTGNVTKSGWSNLGTIDVASFMEIDREYSVVHGNGLVEGISDISKLVIHPYQLSAEDSRRLSTLMDRYLGASKTKILNQKLDQNPALVDKINVIRQFFVENFKYDLRFVGTPFEVFLKGKKGVCQHFAEFALMLLSAKEPVRAATLSHQACGSKVGHDALLIDRGQGTEYVEVTIPPDESIEGLSGPASLSRAGVSENTVPWNRDLNLQTLASALFPVSASLPLPAELDLKTLGLIGLTVASAKLLPEPLKTISFGMSLFQMGRTFLLAIDSSRSTNHHTLELIGLTAGSFVLAPGGPLKLVAPLGVLYEMYPSRHETSGDPLYEFGYIFTSGIVASAFLGALIRVLSHKTQLSLSDPGLTVGGTTRKRVPLDPNRPGIKDWANLQMTVIKPKLYSDFPMKLNSSHLVQWGIKEEVLADACIKQTVSPLSIATYPLAMNIFSRVLGNDLGAAARLALATVWRPSPPTPIREYTVKGYPYLKATHFPDESWDRSKKTANRFINEIKSTAPDWKSVKLEAGEFTDHLLTYALRYAPDMVVPMIREIGQINVPIYSKEPHENRKVFTSIVYEALRQERLDIIEALVDANYPFSRGDKIYPGQVYLSGNGVQFAISNNEKALQHAGFETQKRYFELTKRYKPRQGWILHAPLSKQVIKSRIRQIETTPILSANSFQQLWDCNANQSDIDGLYNQLIFHTSGLAPETFWTLHEFYKNDFPFLKVSRKRFGFMFIADPYKTTQSLIYRQLQYYSRQSDDLRFQQTVS